MTAQRRILVSGWVGATNIGDELIFRSLAHKLQQRGVRVQAMSTDPAETQQLHGVEGVGWYDLPAVVRAVAKCDAFVLGPGGLLQDETSVWNLPAHLHRVFGAKVARKPVIGMGLGVGPVTSKPSQRLVRAALRATPITVRDGASAAVAAGIGLKDVTVTADLAYGLPIPRVEPRDRIIVSLRPFSGGGGVTPARRSDLKTLQTDDRVRAAAKSLDELSHRLSLPIHLLAFESERDVLYHDLVAAAMATSVTTSMASVESAFQEVARSRLVVAMRYHTAVAAIMALRPTVVINYSPKMQNVARTMGPAGLLVENDDAAYRDIVKGSLLVDRQDDLEAVRAERIGAEQGNDEAIDRLLSRL
jgi:polysaccharide pyruvyl transferase CsaB